MGTQIDNARQKVLKETRKETPPPSKYHVIYHNDDFTPMDFVVDTLIKYFGHSEDMAVDIMFKVHHDGKAVAGTYQLDIAEMKAYEVTTEAEKREHPLKVTIQADE